MTPSEPGTTVKAEPTEVKSLKGEPLDTVFQNFNRVVRFLASGGVSLAIAHLYNNGCLKDLNVNLGATSTWWPMLFLAATIGLLIYAFTATLMWWPFPLLLWVRLLQKGGENGDMGVRAGLRWYNHQRWLRRASDDKRIRKIQDELDWWGSLEQFLYCSAYAMILTPLVMRYLLQIKEQIGVPCRPWYSPLIGGGILLIIAVAGDGFKLSRECWVSHTWPEKMPTPASEKAQGVPDEAVRAPVPGE